MLAILRMPFLLPSPPAHGTARSLSFGSLSPSCGEFWKLRIYLANCKMYAKTQMALEMAKEDQVIYLNETPEFI